MIANGVAQESTEDLGRILLDRARLLGQTGPNGEDSCDLEVLVFALGEEHYAVDIRSLRSVERTKGLTAVPCTPAFIAGTLNLRGEVLTVLNLAAALSISSLSPRAADQPVLVTETRNGRVGLQVDEIVGVEPIRIADLGRPLSGRDFARGIVRATVVLLDLDQLLIDERFIVSEEVG